MRVSRCLLLVIGACSAKPVTVPEAPVVVAAPAAVDAGVIDAAWAADEGLVGELRAIAKARLEELHGERPDHDVEPAPGLDDEAGVIPVLGACERPGAAERKEIEGRVEAWIRRRYPGEKRVEGEVGSVRFGCVEAGGMVVDAQADLERARRRVGRWWTLRVTAKRIEVIEETSGCAVVDCMEWSDVASVQTLVLADLDGDARRDPIIVRDRHEGGAARQLDVIVGGKTVGHVEGELGLPPRQPLPPARAVLVSVDATDGTHVFRCITATGPWSDCAEAEETARRVRAFAAAEMLAASPTGLLEDRHLLAYALEALGVAERERYLAAAAPGSLASEVTVFLKRRGEASAQLTVEERAAAVPAEARRQAAELMALLGHAPCPAAAGEARIERWVDARHPDASRFRVVASCTGRAGAYWLVEWYLASAPDPVARRALLHVAGAKIAALAEGQTALDDDGDGPYPRDVHGLPEAKFHLQGASIAALVRGPGDLLTAVIDGKVTGSRAVPADLWWNAYGGGEMFEMLDDSLARSHLDELTQFWQATPTGPSPVAELPPIALTAPPAQTTPAAAWLERSERRRRAESVLQVPPHPGRSEAELRAALAELTR